MEEVIVNMTFKPPYVVTFNEMGGYDAMSSAYQIRDSTGALVADIDISNFINHRQSDKGGVIWEESHEENYSAKVVATIFCDALNKSGFKVEV